MLNLYYYNKKTLNEIEKLIQEKRMKQVPVNKGNNTGIFIHGDNFEGMISLLDEFENKIDLVYIDKGKNSYYKKIIKR